MLKNALPYDGEGVYAGRQEQATVGRALVLRARETPQNTHTPVWGFRAEDTY